jgi:hypothetical protein
LTKVIVTLASEYRRYGYPRTTAVAPGWPERAELLRAWECGDRSSLEQLTPRAHVPFSFVVNGKTMHGGDVILKRFAVSASESARATDVTVSEAHIS